MNLTAESRDNRNDTFDNSLMDLMISFVYCFRYWVDNGVDKSSLKAPSFLVSYIFLSSFCQIFLISI